MRVGLVRNVALGMVALVGLGLAGCDDNPTDFASDESVKITTNPSVMTVPAGVTTLLSSRTLNAGNEPTWQEIDASVDGSCGSGAVSVAVAASYEPALEPPGVFDVTGGTTWGETCIQLSGGGQSATVEVMVVADSLEITGAPASGQLVVFETVQLSANLLGDDGSGVGPFDPTTDLVWSSDDEAVLTVDGTGLVTAVGAGTATITATWTEFGVSVSASTTITVTVPAPTLTSTDVATAEIGEVVTVTGTGFIPGAHAIFVDGVEVGPVLEATIVNTTTATFRMPGGTTATAVITIGVAGDVSNELTVDRTDSTEPANNDPATAPLVTLPVDLYGYVDADDPNDFFSFTLAAETTFELFLNWDGTADLDIIITDAVFSQFPCFAASLDQPEQTTCTLGAGSWILWINDYNGVPATYNARMTP